MSRVLCTSHVRNASSQTPLYHSAVVCSFEVRGPLGSRRRPEEGRGVTRRVVRGRPGNGRGTVTGSTDTRGLGWARGCPR